MVASPNSNDQTNSSPIQEEKKQEVNIVDEKAVIQTVRPRHIFRFPILEFKHDQNNDVNLNEEQSMILDRLETPEQSDQREQPLGFQDFTVRMRSNSERAIAAELQRIYVILGDVATREVQASIEENRAHALEIRIGLDNLNENGILSQENVLDVVSRGEDAVDRALDLTAEHQIRANHTLSPLLEQDEDESHYYNNNVAPGCGSVTPQ